MSVIVTLLGEPVAWARARANYGTGAHFTPPKQRSNAATLRMAAQAAMGNRVPFDCAVQLNLTAEFGIPASWSKRKQTAALMGEIRPAKKPDLSNIIKQVEDAFNTVVFRDDALIVEYGCVRKLYSLTPKLTITIEPINMSLTTEQAA